MSITALLVVFFVLRYVLAKRDEKCPYCGTHKTLKCIFPRTIEDAREDARYIEECPVCGRQHTSYNDVKVFRIINYRIDELIGKI